MAQLSHSSIVTVHEFGDVNGFPYLVIEYVDGLSLRDVLEGQPLGPADALAIVLTICSALQYAPTSGSFIATSIPRTSSSTGAAA